MAEFQPPAMLAQKPMIWPGISHILNKQINNVRAAVNAAERNRFGHDNPPMDLLSSFAACLHRFRYQKKKTPILNLHKNQ